MKRNISYIYDKVKDKNIGAYDVIDIFQDIYLIARCDSTLIVIRPPPQFLEKSIINIL